jgi:hypothetical protein
MRALRWRLFPKYAAMTIALVTMRSTLRGSAS